MRGLHPRTLRYFLLVQKVTKKHTKGRKQSFLPFVPLFPLTGKFLPRGTSVRSLVQTSPLILSPRTESSVFLGWCLHYAYSVSVGPDFCIYYAGTVRCCRPPRESRIETHPVGRQICLIQCVVLLCGLRLCVVFRRGMIKGEGEALSLKRAFWLLFTRAKM